MPSDGSTVAKSCRSPRCPFPSTYEREGFDCGKCGARCPPTGGQHKSISPHLFCFFVDHVDVSNSLKLICEASETKGSTKLEACVTQKSSQYLTAIHLCNKFSPCTYCVRCFHKFAPEMAKHEANNVIRFYGIDVASPVFTA
jgi:hypothetical protein